MNSPRIYDEYQSDRNDSQSDEMYTTPISPLSPQEKSPPAPPPTVSSPTNHSIEQTFESNSVKEMQIFLHSSTDLSFPLQDSWSFWYFKNGRIGDWKDNLIHITTVSTVEAFWSVFNHLQSPSRLEQGCDYFLFKIHIQPMWEDPRNKTGGRWSLNLNKSQRTTDLDRYWMNTLLSLIGDQYPDPDYVNGCVVSVRSKGDRISLWTREWKNIEMTRRIGTRFREVADIARTCQLLFESHEDQESKRGPSSKILFRA